MSMRLFSKYERCSGFSINCMDAPQNVVFLRKSVTIASPSKSRHISDEDDRGFFCPTKHIFGTGCNDDILKGLLIQDVWAQVHLQAPMCDVQNLFNILPRLRPLRTILIHSKIIFHTCMDCGEVSGVSTDNVLDGVGWMAKYSGEIVGQHRMFRQHNT
mmetsp:Transcript_23494/g.36219  ORF Transcript_23494/g.36219 Transcript_23494/m.36219 type:complete len:158 (+) Transcript_23494:594-1067(+)